MYTYIHRCTTLMKGSYFVPILCLKHTHSILSLVWAVAQATHRGGGDTLSVVNRTTLCQPPPPSHYWCHFRVISISAKSPIKVALMWPIPAAWGKMGKEELQGLSIKVEVIATIAKWNWKMFFFMYKPHWYRCSAQSSRGQSRWYHASIIQGPLAELMI